MYRIIGSDGKEYGPVSAEQLRDWIAQGRVNAQTQILAEGSTAWRPLSDFPEFMVAPAPPPQTLGAMPPAAGNMLSAAARVNAPATGLIVTAVIGFLYQVGSLIMHFTGMGMGMMQMPQGHGGAPPAWAMLMSGTFVVIFAFIALAASVVILIGGLKMKKLESYGLAMTASIVAALPCISPCCVIGLPIGIWAIVVLSKPEVKAAFNQNG